MARRDLSGAVDFARLEAYAAQDAALIEEVLGLFEEQAALWMRLLEGPAGPGARDAAHTLKGASLGIGADALAEACAQAERDAETALLPMRAGAVRDALDRTLADIAAYRHEVMLRSLRPGG